MSPAVVPTSTLNRLITSPVVTPTAKATSVHDTVNAASFRFPSAEELAKRLRTTVNKSHKVIKPMTTNQFKAE
jgi:hypothetical protein